MHACQLRISSDGAGTLTAREQAPQASSYDHCLYGSFDYARTSPATERCAESSVGVADTAAWGAHNYH
jgi:hypothetical protein